MTHFTLFLDANDFASEYWATPAGQQRNVVQLRMHGYLKRSSTMFGRKIYLQAWMLADGRVVAKTSHSLPTAHGLAEFLSRKGVQLAPSAEDSYARAYTLEDWP